MLANPEVHAKQIQNGEQRKSMKQIAVILSALFAGFIGGVLGTFAIRTREQLRPEQVVRARSFQLVNSAGQAISYWGVDNGQNAVIAFANRGLAGGAVLPGKVPLDLRDADNQLAAIGLQGNDMPFLKMSGADRKTRVILLLSQDSKPALAMEDETGLRLHLGVEGSDTPGPQDNDWSLFLRPEVARIGLHAEKKGGQMYVQGGVFVNKGKVQYPYQPPK
jgi:hypothetical protein